MLQIERRRLVGQRCRPTVAFGQEAAAVEQLAEQAAKVLGRETFENTASKAIGPAFEKMMGEAASEGPAARDAAEASLHRVVAQSDSALIERLETFPGKALPLLEDVETAELPSAMSTLSRPGVAEAVETLGTKSLRRAAIIGEIRVA